MKKIINKLFLIFAIVSLIVPTTFVSATETPENGTGNSGGEVSTPVGGESDNNGNTGGATEGGNTQTPTPSPTPETPKIEAKLDSLEVSGYKLKEEFSKERREYTLTVKSDVQSVTINARAAEGVTVSGHTGAQELKEGLNTFEIVSSVANDDGTIDSIPYKVKITRSTSDLGLKILSIKGHPLNETFDPTITDYTADVSYDTQSVIVNAGANNGDAKPQISGNSNLKVGKNTVRIIVKNSSGETQEYRIIVNRASEEEQEENDDDTTSATSSETVTSSEVVTTPSEDDSDDNNNSGNTLKYVLVVIFCIILLIIAGLGIYFYVRTGNIEKRKQKRIEKLKKKQAKIDQELTALLPVITDEIIEEHNKKITDSENEEFDDKDFEDTIELDEIVEEKTETTPSRKRVDKNVLEDFDDLFLDE